MSHHDKKCKFTLNAAGDVEFITPHNLILCFISQTHMPDPNYQYKHSSDTLIITDIDPTISFDQYANLEGCAFRTIKSQHEENQPSIHHFFAKLDKGTESGAEIQQSYLMANQMWDLIHILRNFNRKQLEGALAYIEFKENIDSHRIKELYSIAEKMIKVHIKCLENSRSDKIYDLVIDYYDLGQQFQTVALKNGSAYSNYSFQKNTPHDQFLAQKELLVSLAVLFFGYAGFKFVTNLAKETVTTVVEGHVGKTKSKSETPKPKSKSPKSKPKSLSKPKPKSPKSKSKSPPKPKSLSKPKPKSPSNPKFK